MPVHIKEKIIVVSGRRWQIKKFDALTGSYVALKLMSKISHIVFGVVGGNLTDPVIIGNAVAAELGTFSKGEFGELQAESLHVCSEVKTVEGKDMFIPIMTTEGAWATPELENDALLVMALVSHVLVFNMTSFFEESALKEVVQSFKDLNLFNAST